MITAESAGGNMTVYMKGFGRDIILGGLIVKKVKTSGLEDWKSIV